MKNSENSFSESSEKNVKLSQLCRYFLYATSEKAPFKLLFAVIDKYQENFLMTLRAVQSIFFCFHSATHENAIGIGKKREEKLLS